MSDEFDYEPVPGKNPQTLECLPKGKIGELRAEIARLQRERDGIELELIQRAERNEGLRAELEILQHTNESLGITRLQLRAALERLVYCYRGRWFSRVHTEHDITDIVGNLGLNDDGEGK